MALLNELGAKNWREKDVYTSKNSGFTLFLLKRNAHFSGFAYVRRLVLWIDLAELRKSFNLRLVHPCAELLEHTALRILVIRIAGSMM